MMKKKALITGITGQDGSYLTELLLDKGYEVFGFVRQVYREDASNRLSRIYPLLDRINLIAGSLESYPSIYKAVLQSSPDEIYHLAAQSYVNQALDDEFSTINVNINGTHQLLAACKDIVPQSRFYFAGSSEMFGASEHFPQNEHTPFFPRSAYGISKLAGYHLVRNYRQKYKLYASTGILYNHESPRRGFEFVTRKVTSTAAKIKLKMASALELGNLQAQRDWGHAKEFVYAIWRMLQCDLPDDYVIATGKLHSVKELCEIAFSYLGLDYIDFVRINKQFYREENHVLVGDAEKAKKAFGWRAEKSFRQIIEEMVDNDLSRLQKQNFTDPANNEGI
jgi:GDPmannose 4,6-dehydratase